MSAFIPFALQAYGTMQSGKRDAALMESQGRVAAAQSYADEQANRRASAGVLGDQAASLAEAGSVGGTGEIVQRQSAIAAELDALNIRYKGQLQRVGLYAQASATRQDSKLMAGAQLLRGVASSYRTPVYGGSGLLASG